jgi:hypothetical protein
MSDTPVETRPRATYLTNGYVHGDHYLEIQHFYAWQMQLLDEDLVEAWAQTFTEDGVFAANAQPQPTSGREAITASARAAREDLARRGVQTRHCLMMLVVTSDQGDTVKVRSYAVVIETPIGGAPKLHVSTVCEDELVRDSGRWLVRDRYVTRDDIV